MISLPLMRQALLRYYITDFLILPILTLVKLCVAVVLI